MASLSNVKFLVLLFLYEIFPQMYETFIAGIGFPDHVMSWFLCFFLWFPTKGFPQISETFIAGLEFPSHVMLGQSTSLKCSFTRAPSQKVRKVEKKMKKVGNVKKKI